MAGKNVKSDRQGKTRPVVRRLQRMLELLEKKTYPSCGALALELEVSEKTIRRDIEYARDQLGWPLEYDARRYGYVLTGSVAYLPGHVYEEGELLALVVAKCALPSVLGGRLEGVVRDAIRSLSERGGGLVEVGIDEMEAVFAGERRGVVETNIDVLEKCLAAAARRVCLRFSYLKPGSVRAERRHVEPWQMGEMDGGWYMLGWDRKRSARRLFSLCRMSKLEVTEEGFEMPVGATLGEHLKNSFGLVRNEKGECEEVVIRFMGNASVIAGERRWHPSQRLRKIRGGVEMTLMLDGYEEAARWVLGWGGDAEAVSPAGFRRAVAELGRRLSALHRG